MDAILAPSTASTTATPTRISGIVWNEVIFKEYIKDPRGKVPGTKMIFAGIKSEKEVGDLWSYVSQFDKDGNVKK